MLKVLLADDNNLTLNQLNEIFMQLAGRAAVVGQAMNGRQAVELARRLEPDLVIMDVEMPVLGGIDAAREILAALPWVKVLALSNYDSFQYLRGMMQAGAVDYLLKHELSPALVGRQLREVERLRDKEAQSAIREQYFSLIAKQSFFLSLLNEVDSDPRYEKIMLQQKEFSGHKSALCILHIMNFRSFYQAQRQEKLIQSVLNICSNVFSTIGNGLITPVVKEEFAVLFNFDGEVSQNRIAAQLQAYMALLKGNLKRLLNLDVLMGSRLIYGSLSALPRHYRQLNEELCSKPLFQPPSVPRLDILEERALIDSLDQRDLAGAEEALSRIFKPLREKPDGQRAESLAGDLVLLLERYLQQQNLSDENGWLQRFKRDFSADQPVEQLYKSIAGLFEKILGSRGDPKFSSYSAHTQKAVVLMRRQYAENLSLTGVSEKIGLSAAYLSKIFKAETGCTFVDYLTALRISRAKALLTSTDFSIREISERTGFGSSNYFIKVFRSQMGETPMQYQSRVQKKEKPLNE